MQGRKVLPLKRSGFSGLTHRPLKPRPVRGFFSDLRTPRGHRLPIFINDPEHWRERAEGARKFAEQMTDDAAKQAMLRIAEDYEKLAERAAARASAAKK